MKIHIPTPLRAYTDKQETISARGATVAEGLESLVQQFPTMRGHLFTPDGKLRSFVNVYVNDEDIRYLPEKENTPADDATELTIIPSIAGGCPETATAPHEEMEHAQRLLSCLNGEQVHAAIYAMEDILEGAVYVTDDMPSEDEDITPNEEMSANRGRADLAAGRSASMEQLCSELGFSSGDFESSQSRNPVVDDFRRADPA